MIPPDPQDETKQAAAANSAGASGRAAGGDAVANGPPAFVVCGASAGGLEAFSQLLAALPTDVRAAFVLVPHLAPEHESMMPKLLQHHTTLPVTEATHGATIERGRVYVAPPGMTVEVHEGRIGLSPRPEGMLHPIDHCFRSLAQLDGRAIAVVLSGTGVDGSAGIRDVRAAGGITMAQAPESAKYDGMPVAAIATNAVDVILPRG
jgi:two-component system CheB/CheR fusion protein